MKRLNFLRNKYNIVDLDDKRLCEKIEDGDSYDIKIGEALLDKIIQADPTKNKMYVQWVLNLFIREAKEDWNKGQRFIREDLSKTRGYLELFESHKRKKRFSELALKNPASMGIKNPVDINQYSSLEQLYSVVYPFILKVNLSELEEEITWYANAKQGTIAVDDEQYLVFIPHTLAASELFSFTNWCTAQKGNTMFSHYTKQFEPDGSPSKLYIVIDKGFFKGENEYIYQAHFPSKQFMDKKDRSVIKDFHSLVLQNSLAVRNFFKLELIRLLNLEGKSNLRGRSVVPKRSFYHEMALKLKLGEVMFEALDTDTLSIVFTDEAISTIPSLAKYKSLRVLYLDNVGLSELRPDMVSSKNLRLLQVPRNNLTTLPKEIGLLKNLLSINILENPITSIPEEIKYLDPKNGGSLELLAIDTSENLLKELQILLPTVDII